MKVFIDDAQARFEGEAEKELPENVVIRFEGGDIYGRKQIFISVLGDKITIRKTGIRADDDITITARASNEIDIH